MNWAKKFWIVFFSFLPFGAAAFPAWLIKAGLGLASVVGYSVYRSNVPVNLSESVEFFSSCWSCQLFSDVLSTLSSFLPKIYAAMGRVTVTMIFALTGIWIAWRVASRFIDAKQEKSWDITSEFVVPLIKLVVVCALLLMPLPRMISDIAIEPIFNVGMTMNRIAVHDDTFNQCVVATAISDPTVVSTQSANAGAFSPRMRHSLTCELAGIHQLTGLGMAIGWVVTNMAFDNDYMFKLFNFVPCFPNLLLIVVGVGLIALYMLALLPIPIYFLEVFVKLALDLVMLPLMMLSWLFKGWKITLDGAGKSIKQIINDMLSATLGIAMTCVFVSFSVMLFNAIFGDWQGASALITALEQNDSKFLMDSLMMAENNDSFITIVLMGLFFVMYMNMIPALIKTLFNVQISDEFYEGAKKDIKSAYEGGKKWLSNIKK